MAEKKTGRNISKQLGLFARNFIKHPTMLGSVIPSSRFLVNDLMSQVDWERARVVVEYGPGVGTITQQVLKRMRPDAALVVIELNRDFVEYLRREVKDPRLTVLCGSAADARALLASVGISQADYVISGIPFSTLPHRLRRELCNDTKELLSPAGTCLVYQFTAVALPYLKSHFRSVEEGFQPWNILPARLFYCTP